jgi:hypothetical protein
VPPARKVFPKVVDILGHNIFCYHAYLFATPGQGSRPADPAAAPTFGFHQDSGTHRDTSDCHFRKATGYDREPGIKWVSRAAK